MVEFKHFKGIGKDDEEIEITIASGPVVVEKDKVLLDKDGKDGFWKFPGGMPKVGEDFQSTARRRVKEELGIDVRLEKKPCVLVFERDHNGVKEYVLLFHYLAKRRRRGKIKKGKGIKEFKWIGIKNLPEDIAPNIKPVLKYFKFI